MNNYTKISTADELHKLIENAQDKLVILMFYTKGNVDCRRMSSAFETCSLKHNLSTFCQVDMDKFQGESRFVNSNINMPKFDLYHMGSFIGTHMTTNDKDIEGIVRSGEQYVMMQNNMKNNNSQMGGMMIGGQMGGQMPTTNTMQINTMQINPMQYQQIQQQILNQAQMQSPQQFQFLMQNPAYLQGMVQKQLQQQQMQQQQMQQQQQQMPHQMQLTMQPQMPIQQQQLTMQPIMSQASMTTPMPAQNTTTTNSLFQAMSQLNTDTSMLPTLQQMQQMFQIFQLMQQAGLLTTQPPAAAPAPPPLEPPKEAYNEKDVVVLPNGDKIIPLANGKFGLVRKQN